MVQKTERRAKGGLAYGAVHVLACVLAVALAMPSAVVALATDVEDQQVVASEGEQIAEDLSSVVVPDDDDSSGDEMSDVTEGASDAVVTDLSAEAVEPGETDAPLATMADSPIARNTRNNKTFTGLADSFYAGNGTQDGDTIVLLRDGSGSYHGPAGTNKGTTFDLGGHTLTIAQDGVPIYGKNSDGSYYRYYTGFCCTAGTLTIKNGTIIASSLDAFVSTHEYGRVSTIVLGEGLTVKCLSSAILAENGCKVIIDGATVICTDQDHNAAFANGKNSSGTPSTIEVRKGSISQTGSSMVTMSARSGGSIIISGGTVHSGSSTALAAHGDGTVITVSGGEVTNGGRDLDGKTGVNGPWVGYATEKGKIVVSGGTVKSTLGNGLYAYNSDEAEEHRGLIEVSGGTVSASSAYAVFSSGGSCEATISGGSIVGKVRAGTKSSGKDDKLSISGGTVDGAVECDGDGCKVVATGGIFTKGISDAYVAQGYAAVSTKNRARPAEVEVRKVTLSAAQQPTVYDRLVYNGTFQELVADPVELPEGYVDVMYSLDGSSWSEDIPKGRAADEYAVYVRYVGDDDHGDFTWDTLYATIDSASNGDVETHVTVGEGAPDVVAPNIEDIADAILDNPDRSALEEGAYGRVWLESTLLSAGEVPVADKALLEDAAQKQGATPGIWFDLSLWKQMTGMEERQIRESSVPLKLSVEVPESLLKYGRTYYLLSSYDGNVAIVAQGTGATLTGETSTFSTCLIAYKDASESSGFASTPSSPSPSGGSAARATLPKTGDDVLYWEMAFVACAGMGLILFGLAHRRTE